MTVYFALFILRFINAQVDAFLKLPQGSLEGCPALACDQIILIAAL